VDLTGAEDIRYRRLAPGELARVEEIDRTERIDAGYVQRGDRLEEIAVDWSAPPWLREGDGEHSIAHQVAFCERHVRAGGIPLGAFDGDRLVGIGLVTPHVRPGIAQLAFLHVSDGCRGRGVGTRLAEELEDLARAAGDAVMVVSATPSRNTVRFYLGLGYEPTAEPLPELLELEPEDVHLRKAL
jgi:GNAT superfamily N-acetyltransferase